ncbi:hypothetical protein N657DRAFT_638540 [Parathielavia appendiculata]|uniref:DnaJ-like protein C11 C-terminal domain-containing protein n=1 Tax=Parathielavia appendiculata TaxID=2587402 RepID=A0AAN6U7Z6_9PEZI|nr:hypothetical protein N657DRAFT_638540 [Parathielavia appendiculata]
MDFSSRRVPSATVDDGASIRSRTYHDSTHRLRPAESHFSLREQFAATRREYEFGFDDGSSVLAQSTLASEAAQVDDLHDIVTVESNSRTFPDSRLVYRDCYELFCLPSGPSLSPEQVQEAARRLNRLLAVDTQPPQLQSAAAFYLGLVQAAYVTLIDPSRRLGYDLSRLEEACSDWDSEEETVGEVELANSGSSSTYKSRLHDQYLLLTQRESRATSDLGLRIDACSQRHGAGLAVLDLCLRKSATVSVPALRWPIERTVYMLRGLTQAPGSETTSPLRLADPSVTISGLAHGLLDEPFKLASLSTNRYQPPGPPIHGPRRMEQLLASRFLPVLSLNVREEVSWQPAAHREPLPDLVVEQEVEILPQLCAITRIGRSINLLGSGCPLNVEVSAHKLLTRRNDLLPSLGLAVHQRVGAGTAYILMDGGDWNLRISRKCREVFEFSKISRGVVPVLDAFWNPPTCEIGYAFCRHDLGMQPGQAFTKPSERGLSSLDCDLDENKPSSWTISGGLTQGNAAAYLRYSRHLFSPPTSRPSSLGRHNETGFRAEAELAGTTHRDFVLAFRALKCIGRFSKAGVEIGLSPSNLHLSLYWSRLGQRISLPILVAAPHQSSLTTIITRVLFLSTVLPFTALSAWELYRHSQRHRAAAKTLTTTTTTTGAEYQENNEKVQAYVARRRAEADELTVILATGVELRQRAERGRGGLVIVSAKYGVRDAPPEEVADVTIAVAALVDNHDDDDDDDDDHDDGGEGARLVIPKEVRKSRLLGFWDPAPGRTKVLRVRYLWRGREGEVEVCGRDELRLP